MLRASAFTAVGLFFLVLPIHSRAANGPIRIPGPDEGTIDNLLPGLELKFSDCSIQSRVGLLKMLDVDVSQLVIARISSPQPQPFRCSV